MNESRLPLRDFADTHPASAKAWEWFRENQNGMSYDRRESIFRALLAADVELWKLDNSREALGG